jgi:hypothetical protein
MGRKKIIYDPPLNKEMQKKRIMQERREQKEIRLVLVLLIVVYILKQELSPYWLEQVKLFFLGR